jgi:hypothetical protein
VVAVRVGVRVDVGVRVAVAVLVGVVVGVGVLVGINTAVVGTICGQSSRQSPRMVLQMLSPQAVQSCGQFHVPSQSVQAHTPSPHTAESTEQGSGVGVHEPQSCGQLEQLSPQILAEGEKGWHLPSPQASMHCC